MSEPFVSIIIPCREVDNYTKECVVRCRQLRYPAFEIIVLPDDAAGVEGAVVKPTGPVSPGRKRNVGASAARGDVLAYIDSDAYPREDWLANGISRLAADNVGAVGGPGLTAPGDGRFAKAQDALLSSYLVGGISKRYSASGVVETDDIHSVNFVAWRKVIESVGGWNEHYWPGEDTLMCLAIRKAGYKQLLAPDVVVYHHRRPTMSGYLRQIANYGLHRGFFAKRFPETSRRFNYFVPTIMTVGFVLLVALSLLLPFAAYLLLAAIVAYLIPVIALAARSGEKTFIAILVGVPLTHFVYGVSFARGLLALRLTR